jgi:hypothetical protein
MGSAISEGRILSRGICGRQSSGSADEYRAPAHRTAVRTGSAGVAAAIIGRDTGRLDPRARGGPAALTPSGARVPGSWALYDFANTIFQLRYRLHGDKHLVDRSVALGSADGQLAHSIAVAVAASTRSFPPSSAR